MHLAVGCSYYTVRDLPANQGMLSSELNELEPQQSYAIVHTNSGYWHLSNFVVDDVEQHIYGVKQPLDAIHSPKKVRENKKTYRNKGGDAVLHEVHFYVRSSIGLVDGAQVSIPFFEIKYISVNDKNTGRSTVNVVAGVLGVVAMIAIGAAIFESSFKWGD
ncbi:hypothetical protein [Mangrovimonas sp. TPBH4]|uniref:hypothetical protein n=1 Tax=Mangrovimonas sp. TPBH4 TaxID=1645914 RepID=UPI0012F8B1B3|nr:hypothetical protein [Mangrovimonas sp. TPBH4]